MADKPEKFNLNVRAAESVSYLGSKVKVTSRNPEANLQSLKKSTLIQVRT